MSRKRSLSRVLKHKLILGVVPCAECSQAFTQRSSQILSESSESRKTCAWPQDLDFWRSQRCPVWFPPRYPHYLTMNLRRWRKTNVCFLLLWSLTGSLKIYHDDSGLHRTPYHWPITFHCIWRTTSAGRPSVLSDGWIWVLLCYQPWTFSRPGKHGKAVTNSIHVLQRLRRRNECLI